MISFDIEYNTTGATLAWKQHILTTYNDGSMNDEVSTVSRDLSFSVNENPYSVYHYEQINFENKSELVEIIQGRMPIISNYLRFDATTNDVNIGLSNYKYFIDPLCSFDGVDWFDFPDLVSLKQGETLYIKANGVNTGATNASFTTSALVECHGDVRSLLAYEGFENAPLVTGCFRELFGYTNITTAPELPSTALAYACYQSMFVGCRSLKTPPQLPATELAEYCYNGMFFYCSSMEYAPELPAIVLAKNCYSMMFNSCTSLTTAPELPAETLIDYCYSMMFINCSKLSYIKVRATNWDGARFSYKWVDGVASTGTFVKPSETNISRGIYGIPSNWTVENI